MARRNGARDSPGFEAHGVVVPSREIVGVEKGDVANAQDQSDSHDQQQPVAIWAALRTTFIAGAFRFHGSAWQNGYVSL